MKIRKFNESEGFNQSVKDIFSYIVDEFNGYTMVGEDAITFIFDIESDYDQKDFRNLYDGIKLYDSYLSIMNGLVECLEKLSLYSDVYYYFSIKSNGFSVAMLKKNCEESFPRYVFLGKIKYSISSGICVFPLE